MADPYTHIFKFEINGSHIRGEVEFNTDGKVSIKPEEWSQPIQREHLDYFSELLELIRDIVHTGGENSRVKKIVIKEKEA